jgi:hypothetical protein
VGHKLILVINWIEEEKKMASFLGQQRASNDPPFYTADVRDILRSIETTKHQKTQIEQKLAAHVAKTIEAKFEPALLEEMKKLEDEELELVRIDVSLREKLVETLQQARRHSRPPPPICTSINHACISS